MESSHSFRKQFGVHEYIVDEMINISFHQVTQHDSTKVITVFQHISASTIINPPSRNSISQFPLSTDLQQFDAFTYSLYIAYITLGIWKYPDPVITWCISSRRVSLLDVCFRAFESVIFICLFGPGWPNGEVCSNTSIQRRASIYKYSTSAAASTCALQSYAGWRATSGINTADFRWALTGPPFLVTRNLSIQNPKATCFWSDDFPTKILPMKQAFKSPNSFRQHVMNTRAPPDGLKTRDVWITVCQSSDPGGGQGKLPSEHTTSLAVPEGTPHYGESLTLRNGRSETHDRNLRS